MAGFWDDLGEDEEDGRDRPRRRGFVEMLRRVLPLFRPHLRTVASGLGLLLVATAADTAAPLVLKRIIDVDIASGSRRALVASAGLFTALFLAARVADYVKVSKVARMGLDIVTGLKRRLFDHMLSLGMDFFDRHATGRLLSRVESDTEKLLALFTEVGLTLFGSLVMLVVTLAVMLLADARITLAVLLLVVPITALNLWGLERLRGRFVRGRKAYAELTGLIAEQLAGAPVIQAYGLEEDAAKRLAERQRAFIHAEIGAESRAYALFGLLSALEVGVVMVVVALGTGSIFGATLKAGTLVLFVEYARRLFMPILLFSEQVSFLQRAFAAADRVFDVLDTPSRTPERKDASSEAPRAFAELRFEGVRFAYGDTPARALDGLDCTIRSGERVALVGHSGSGKSTVLKLLLRFHEPTEGRIAIDGRDIRELTHEAWRRGIGLVLQDIHLFPATLRENLTALRGDIPDEAIVRALHTVEADDLLRRLPKGLDTELDEGGHNLSLGERQLCCFARAIVRDPMLLLLDEATSSIDPGTERRIQAALERILAGRTSITIAHRLSTVIGADRILLVDKGRLVDAGTHAELLGRSPLYQELCRLQLQATLDAPAAPGLDAEDGAGAVGATVTTVATLATVAATVAPEAHDELAEAVR